jgi:hypothetical protein
MNNHFQSLILQSTGATSLVKIEIIQRLWSDYGEIIRYGLEGSELQRVVVKHVRLPDQTKHPRGWNTDLSHQRKIKSYQVETTWYRQWSHMCSAMCRVPRCLALESQQDEMFILLEDLDHSGFPARLSQVSMGDVKTCLSWLAHFHALFMGQSPDNLWEEGTYWHLATRPDELQALQDSSLKHAATTIDRTLRESPFQTFVHGDAKLANFCFSDDGNNVAAVDFQYVGGGCGMKDVAYFIGSCLDERQCQQHEVALLDFYFDVLKKALTIHHENINPNDVEHHWRPLYHVAWTDFYRFIKGWSPGHWKINGYSEKIARKVILQLTNNE